ncbi:hypothetical protein B0H13DRAFT_1866410 [Mycena leptocephala]|nr:hypothetical protein B0H13DRAFT_1866410 [Mycena leptocephala]
MWWGHTVSWRESVVGGNSENRYYKFDRDKELDETSRAVEEFKRHGSVLSEQNERGHPRSSFPKCKSEVQYLGNAHSTAQECPEMSSSPARPGLRPVIWIDIFFDPTTEVNAPSAHLQETEVTVPSTRSKEVGEYSAISGCTSIKGELHAISDEPGSSKASIVLQRRIQLTRRSAKPHTRRDVDSHLRGANVVDRALKLAAAQHVYPKLLRVAVPGTYAV